MNNPTLVNSKGKRELLIGKLLKGGDKQIIKIPFKYSAYAPRQYNTAMSALPGLEYVSVYEQIRTSRIDLPFAKGDKIILVDGRTMTVDSAMTQIENNKGVYSNDIRTAWIITLNGGGEEPFTEPFEETDNPEMIEEEEEEEEEEEDE